MSALTTTLKKRHGRTKNRIKAATTATHPFIDSRFANYNVFSYYRFFHTIAYKPASHISASPRNALESKRTLRLTFLEYVKSTSLTAEKAQRAR